MGEKTVHFKKTVPQKAIHGDLLRSLSDTRRKIEQAYNQFNYSSDPDLIDASIYEINALQCRYNYLLRQVKACSGSALPPSAQEF